MIYYYLSLGLQAFCIYHAYKNRSEYYWYLVIIMLPYVGSLVYLFTQVIGTGGVSSSVNAAQEGVFNVLYPSKKIKDLEARLDFSDTFENRVALADAYLQNQRYEEAIDMYKSSLNGHYKEDYYVISNLIIAYFKTEQYKKVLEYTEKIMHKMEFKHSATQFVYAKALDKTGERDKAEEELKKLDTPYKNYNERYYLAEFLIANNKPDEAKQVLADVLAEANHMQRVNRRNNRLIIQMSQQLYNQL